MDFGIRGQEGLVELTSAAVAAFAGSIWQVHPIQGRRGRAQGVGPKNPMSICFAYSPVLVLPAVSAYSRSTEAALEELQKAVPETVSQL